MGQHHRGASDNMATHTNALIEGRLRAEMQHLTSFCGVRRQNWRPKPDAGPALHPRHLDVREWAMRQPPAIDNDLGQRGVTYRDPNRRLQRSDRRSDCCYLKTWTLNFQGSRDYVLSTGASTPESTGSTGASTPEPTGTICLP